MQMIIFSKNDRLSQVQMQMINFPESQIQPGSISTFHNFQSNSRSKESEVNHQTCNPPDFIFETSNNKKKHDVVSFKSSNFQKKFLRSNFLIRPWFFSHQKVLNVKSFKICRFYCQRLTRADFLLPPTYESVEIKTKFGDDLTKLGFCLLFISSFVGQCCHEVHSMLTPRPQVEI